MLDFRCSKCKHLLFKELVREGKIEIKCPSCKTFNIIERAVRYKEQKQGAWFDNDKQKSDNKDDSPYRGQDQLDRLRPNINV